MADATAAQIAEAKAQGYSDEEIAKHLSASSPKFKEALEAGYSPSEIFQHLAGPSEKKDRSLYGALAYGAHNMMTGLGQTKDLVTGDPIRPDAPQGNYLPADPIKGFKEGIWPGIKQTGRFAAEMAPAAAGTILGAAAAPEALGATAAAALLGMGMSAGGTVKSVADNKGHASPSLGDVAQGLGTSAVASTISALPVTRFLRGANPITSTASKGIRDSALKLAATTGAESAALGGANVANQVGTTAGSPEGANIDLHQAGNAAIGGAAFGVGARTPRAIADANNAAHFRGVTPELRPSAAALAERIQAASKGKPDEAAIKAAESDLHREITKGAKGVEGLSTDAQNALARPSNLGASELQSLKSELAASEQGKALQFLIDQAQHAAAIRSSGKESNGKLVGGLSGSMEGAMPALGSWTGRAKLAAGATGAHFIPGIGFLSGPLAGILGASYAGARSIDALTGARNPVNRFVKQFQQPGASPRVAPATAPAPAAPVTEAPPGPWGPRPPQTVPNVPLEAPVDPAATQKAQIKEAMDLMAARQANARIQAAAARGDRSNLREQMMDATAQMAARRANAPPEEKQADPVKQQMAEAMALMAARKANEKLGDTRPLQRDAMDQMAARRANAPPQEKTLDPVKQQIAEATMLMAARKANADQQAREARDLMAARVANGTPTPMQRGQMGDARELMAARRANAVDEETPAAMTEAITPEPKVTKVSKANGKTSHTVEVPPLAEAMGVKPFEPKTTDQMPYYGQDHADVADHKLANRPDYKEMSKGRKEVIREGIIRGRTADEGKLAPLVKQTADPQEQAHILELIEELHHTSSRQRAREARDYYASQVNPALGAKIKASVSDAYINKSKRKD